MNLASLKKYGQDKRLAWLVGIIILLAIGYFFRLYYHLFTYLPFSAYDLYFETSLFGPKASSSLLDLFSTKVLSYPLGYYLTLITRHYLPNIFFVYIFGSIIFYFLGKEFSGKHLGGILSFAAFALGYENLIQYTGLTYPSGLCYIFYAAALIFYLKYLKSKKDFHLSLFVICGFATIITYHTGAGAFILIMLGLVISQLMTREPADKRLLLSFFFLSSIYFFWLLYFDQKEFLLISDATQNLNFVKLSKVFYPLLILLFSWVLTLLKIKDWQLLSGGILVSSFLILLPFNVFGILLNLGPENYFASSLTINAVLAQIILFHLYFILLAKKIFSGEEEFQLARGWLIGLIFIFIFLSLENYYVRILDYSFPLAFILFGSYWSRHNSSLKLKLTFIIPTLIIIVISQFVIFTDDFSLRRFYNQEELASAQKIIDLKINGVFASDLRTAALFNYLGENNVYFFNNEEFEHKTLFYEPQNIPQYNFDSYYKNPLGRTTPDFYIILSKSMKKIVYSTNFQTKPVTDEVLFYYQKNYPQIYNDGEMMLYLIYDNPLNDI